MNIGRMRYLAALGVVVGLAMAGPQPLWTQKVAGYADKPTVADLNGDHRLEVILNTDNGNIVAVAGSNGAELWKLATEVERFYNCPIVADADGDEGVEIIVLGSRYGTILCLNGEDGKIVWDRPGKGDGIVGSAAVADAAGNGTPLLFLVERNKLTCLNAGTGQEQWAEELPDKSDGAVTVADLDGGQAEILVGTNSGKLLCFTPAGQVKWTASVRGRIVKPAVVADLDGDGSPEVYVPGDSGLSALDAKGKEKWTWRPKSGRGLSSAMACADLTRSGRRDLAVCSSDGGLYGLKATGAQLWRYEIVPKELPFVPGSTPAAADLNGDGANDLLLCSPRSDDPRLLAVDGRSGKSLWTLQTSKFSQSCPVIADVDSDGVLDVVYCVPGGGSKASLSAVRLGVRGPAGWAKYAGDLANTGNVTTAVTDSAAIAVGRSPFKVAAMQVDWAAKSGPAPERLPGGPAPTTDAPGGRPAVNVAVQLDGKWLLLDPPAAMVGGRVMVPLRGIFEAMAAEVKFEPVTKTITATKGEVVVILRLGDSQASVSGKPVKLDVPAQAVRGSTFVPLRFVGEAFGAEVKWDGAERNVIITTAPSGA